ncbi:hypothetical protein GCM10027202_12330 [Microvirgula curvata]
MKEYKKIKRLVLIVSGVLSVSYFLWFGFFAEFISHSEYFGMRFIRLHLSDETSDWGTFGDFFGGIINPVLGFATLIIVIETARRSQKAVEDSNEIQKDVAEMTKRSLEVSAFLKRKELQSTLDFFFAEVILLGVTCKNIIKRIEKDEMTLSLAGNKAEQIAKKLLQFKRPEVVLCMPTEGIAKFTIFIGEYENFEIFAVSVSSYVGKDRTLDHVNTLDFARYVGALNSIIQYSDYLQTVINEYRGAVDKMI